MNNLKIFLSEVLEEIKKIQWPAKKEFIFSVIVTLVIVVLFSLFFSIVDRTISYLISKIIYFFI